MKSASYSHKPRGRGGPRRNGGGNFRGQSVDSNGPDGKVRGNVHQVHEKYLALARDAASSGDRIAAEGFYQHAEHYYRLINAQNQANAQNQNAGPQRRGRNGKPLPQQDGGGSPRNGRANGGAAAPGSDADREVLIEDAQSSDAQQNQSEDGSDNAESKEAILTS